MDIKELLSLAKDNQSYTQKKFERDKILKNKQKNGNDVSDSAVQSFLAKQQKEKQRFKEKEEAARRKRIEERLQASQGGKVKTGSLASNGDKLGKVEKGEKINPKLEELRRQNLKHLKRPSYHETERKPKEAGAAVAKGKIKEPGKSADRKSSSKVGFKELMNVAKGQAGKTPEEAVKKEYKQHRRKKNTDARFEWSGASSVIERKRGDTISLKAEIDHSRKVEKSKEIPLRSSKVQKKGKQAAPAVNFKDLLKVAQQQANKPTNPVKQKEAATKLQSVPAEKAKEKSKPRETPRERIKGKCVDINSISPAMDKRNGMKVAQARGVSNNKTMNGSSQSRSGGCKLVTQTVDNKRSYGGPQMSSQYRERNPRGVHPKRPVSINSAKNDKFQSIEDELERERRQLEKRRNMLKRKMQGGLPQDNEEMSEYSEDDYDDDGDDDMADFIDDGGDEQDYSKHIRSIFGYDRRKFKDEDDDLAGMESNYRQIAAEEARSAKIAKLEDEIERRREELELKRSKKRR